MSTIAGREAIIGTRSSGWWFIHDRECDWQFRRDGKWHPWHVNAAPNDVWPTEAAAQAFLDAHADKPAGMSKEWLQRMTEAEDRCGGISVGGLAVEMGLYQHADKPTPPADHTADAGKMVAVGEGRGYDEIGVPIGLREMTISQEAADQIDRIMREPSRLDIVPKRIESVGEGQTQAVLALAADIRDVDGGHSLGAAELAEKLIERGWHPTTTTETERLRGEVAEAAELNNEMKRLLDEACDQRDEALAECGRRNHGASGLCCQLRLLEKGRAEAAEAELTTLREQLATAEREREKLQEAKKVSEKRRGVAIIVQRGSKVLACRRTNCRDMNGCWQFGGGAVEDGEAIEQAAYRELNEEAGMLARSMKYLCDAFGYTPEGEPMWTSFFVADCGVCEPEAREPDKHGPWEWVEIEELLARPIVSVMRPAIIALKDQPHAT